MNLLNETFSCLWFMGGKDSDFLTDNRTKGTKIALTDTDIVRLATHCVYVCRRAPGSEGLRPCTAWG